MSREVRTGEKLRRKDDPEKTHSHIQITDLDGSTHIFQLAHTGSKLTLTQCSKLQTKLKHFPSKLERRKRRARHVGGFSIVKPADRLTPKEVDTETKPHTDECKIPKKLAVKIYDTSNKLSTLEQEESAKAAVKCYTALNQFATWFKSNGKVYLVMEWYGNSDLFDDATDDREKKFSTEEVVIAFQKILHKIDILHKLTGKPVNDLKPENMIPIYDNKGNLIDIAIVDVESNQLDTAGPWTPQYQFKQEIARTLASGKIVMDPTFETDCHALATVLAILSDFQTDSRELFTDTVIERFTYPPSESGALSIKHTESGARKYMVTPVKNPAASRAIHALYATLANGKLPINEETPFAVQVFNLQQECKSLFGHIRQQQRVKYTSNPRLFSTTTESDEFITLRETMNDLIRRLNLARITPEELNEIQLELDIIKHKYHNTDREDETPDAGARVSIT